MEKRWLASIFLVLSLVLLVFLTGYSAGESDAVTGYGIFNKIFKKFSSLTKRVSPTGSQISKVAKAGLLSSASRSRSSRSAAISTRASSVVLACASGRESRCDGRDDAPKNGCIDEGCPERCDDEIDNNANGQIDEGCSEELGNDGIDNNANGQIDEGRSEEFPGCTVTSVPPFISSIDYDITPAEFCANQGYSNCRIRSYYPYVRSGVGTGFSPVLGDWTTCVGFSSSIRTYFSQVGGDPCRDISTCLGRFDIKCCE